MSLVVVAVHGGFVAIGSGRCERMEGESARQGLEMIAVRGGEEIKKRI